MQRLLEGGVVMCDVEDALLLALGVYLKHGPAASSGNGSRDKNGGNALPVLIPRQQSQVGNALYGMSYALGGIDKSQLLHMLVS